MGWPKLLVMVRHAESEGNVVSAEDRPKLDKGAQLYDLTERGREQARITGEYIRKEFQPFDVKYTSYYTRAIETMKALLPPDTRWYEDPRLAEAQRGIWHTMTHDEIDRFYPGERLRKAREGLYHYRPPGGENWPDVELRIHIFLSTLARDCAGKSVLMVVHGHWLILLQRLIHHFSIDDAVQKYNSRVAENASVTVYESHPERNGGRLTLSSEEAIVPWSEKL